MYSQLFTVIGPIFIMTAIGYILEKRQTGLDSKTISSLVLLIATPSLIFSKLTSLDVDLLALGTMSLSAALCVALGAVIASVLLKVTGLSFRTFMPSLIMPNSGNVGLPLVLLAFGDEGLTLGVSFFFVIALLQYTVGASIASGEYRFGEIVRQPLIYSIVLVLIVLATGIRVPEVIAKSADLLGGMMIPAMLILLGTSLARLKVSDLPQALIIAIGRLAIGAATGLSVIHLLDLSGLQAGCVFLLATMPAAIVTHVFAERYRPDSDKVAGAVMTSTTLTFAILPVLLWVALSIAGIHP